LIADGDLPELDWRDVGYDAGKVDADLDDRDAVGFTVHHHDPRVVRRHGNRTGTGRNGQGDAAQCRRTPEKAGAQDEADEYEHETTQTRTRSRDGLRSAQHGILLGSKALWRPRPRIRTGAQHGHRPRCGRKYPEIRARSPARTRAGL